MGVCLQSTSYTCGAASIATLLRARGVEAAEPEAARLSHTVPGRGVTDLGAALALRAKLPGRRVEIRDVASPDDLAREPLPCLLPLRYSFWFDHMTVLLRVDSHGFWLGDPLTGPALLTREELSEPCSGGRSSSWISTTAKGR